MGRGPHGQALTMTEELPAACPASVERKHLGVERMVSLEGDLL